LDLLKRSGFENLQERKILEVGCGAGFWLREIIKWGANPSNLTGIDLIPDRIAHAKILCPAAVTLRCGNAEDLDFPDASFDLILQSTVFTSILSYKMSKGLPPKCSGSSGPMAASSGTITTPITPGTQMFEESKSRKFTGCLLTAV
jgi:hypothetical protein